MLHFRRRHYQSETALSLDVPPSLSPSSSPSVCISPGLVEVEEKAFDVHSVSVCLEYVLHALHIPIIAAAPVVAVDCE